MLNEQMNEFFRVRKSTWLDMSAPRMGPGSQVDLSRVVIGELSVSNHPLGKTLARRRFGAVKGSVWVQQMDSRGRSKK